MPSFLKCLTLPLRPAGRHNRNWLHRLEHDHFGAEAPPDAAEFKSITPGNDDAETLGTASNSRAPQESTIALPSNGTT